MANLEQKLELSLEENEEIKSALLEIRSLVIFTYSAIGNDCDESEIEKAKTIFSGLKKVKAVDIKILDSFEWEKILYKSDWSSIILDAINLKYSYYYGRNFCEKEFRTLKRYLPHVQILRAVKVDAGSFN